MKSALSQNDSLCFRNTEAIWLPYLISHSLLGSKWEVLFGVQMVFKRNHLSLFRSETWWQSKEMINNKTTIWRKWEMSSERVLLVSQHFFVSQVPVILYSPGEAKWCKLQRSLSESVLWSQLNWWMKGITNGYDGITICIQNSLCEESPHFRLNREAKWCNIQGTDMAARVWRFHPPRRCFDSFGITDCSYNNKK